ncbi:NADH dehydrogenase subunit 9 [Capsicum annuum]|uniref:Uncharacterized protein n=1 Tax=Capsicum annuum TaxID=4072 RepID=A0A2G2YKT8_CAPAN|nr:NADH dehydrogenase subunit 9 [Capsicum annuum]KAF3678530.1 NADH dehydrogenase subunit 9 [Capsicum annuum]PHT70339.1 hypothetical protein T459_25443 [Capsicum annuum]
MDEVVRMTSGYGCGKQRKLGTFGYLLNQSSDKPSITTTGGEAKLCRQLCFLLASFLAFRSSPTSQVALRSPMVRPSRAVHACTSKQISSLILLLCHNSRFKSNFWLAGSGTTVSCFPCSRQLVLDRFDRVFIIWSKRIQTFACRYQKPMPYHLAILHRNVLDGRNEEKGKGEAGLEEKAEPCKDLGI